jgi:hypothetical protein
VLSGSVSYAQWSLSVEHAGFFGTYALGGVYEFNDRHATELSLGVYRNEGKPQQYQSNLAYRHSLWRVPWEEKMWVPLQLGAFTIYSLDGDHFFLKSPSKYPSAGYYDQTALRWGFEFGTSLIFPKNRFSISYHFRILDNGFVAVYNNFRRDLQYYVSSGINFQYRF